MTTKTAKPKQPKLPPLVTATPGSTLHAAETAVARIVDNGGRFGPADYEAFQTAAWDRRKIKNELARMQSIRDNQRKAGTAEQRKAAAERSAAARDALDKGRIRIENKRLELDAALRKLETEHREAAAAEQPYLDAIGFLTGKRKESEHRGVEWSGALPPYYIQALEDGHADVYNEVGSDIGTLQRTAIDLKRVLSIERRDDEFLLAASGREMHIVEQCAERLGIHCEPRVRSNDDSLENIEGLSVDVDRLFAAAEAELDTINARLRKLTTQKTKATADLDKIRNMFVPM